MTENTDGNSHFEESVNETGAGCKHLKDISVVTLNTETELNDPEQSEWHEN